MRAFSFCMRAHKFSVEVAKAVKLNLCSGVLFGVVWQNLDTLYLPKKYLASRNLTNMCEMDLRSNALINRTEFSHSGRGFCGRLECSQERARFTLWKGDSIGQFVEPTPPITSGSKPRLNSFSSPDQHFALAYRQLTKIDRRSCQLDRLDQLHFRCPRVIKWLLQAGEKRGVLSANKRCVCCIDGTVGKWLARTNLSNPLTDGPGMSSAFHALPRCHTWRCTCTCR